MIKRSGAANPQFLSPQLDLFKENRSRPGNAGKGAKAVPGTVGVSSKSRSNLFEHSMMLLGKIRSLSPMAKIAQAAKRPESSLSPNQSANQTKLRAMLLNKLQSKVSAPEEPLQGAAWETLKQVQLNSQQASAAALTSKKTLSFKQGSKAFENFSSASRRFAGAGSSLLERAAEETTLKSRKTVPNRVKVATRPTEHSAESFPLMYRTTEVETAGPGGELRAKQVVAVLKANIGLLMKIRVHLMGGLDSSTEVKDFLEQSKEAYKIEVLLGGKNPGLEHGVMLLPKYALLLVLFTLNSVEVGGQKAGALQAIEALLEVFLVGMHALSEGLSDSSARQSLQELIRELAECFEQPLPIAEPLRALREVARIARAKLVELAFALYRSHDLCVRLESLALESEKTPFAEVQARAFTLFESILTGSCLEPPSEPESADPSFSCDPEDPNFIVQPLRSEKFLPPRSSPFPPLTLVLDLDETLVHFEENGDGGEFLVRPHASEFIGQMAKYFELVIFTAAVKDYADWILDRIDPSHHISFRLYRQHTQPQNGVYLKDLSRLGRDLSKTIIVDNNAENFSLQPENGIYIKTWHDDPGDNALSQLARLLTSVALQSPADVRIALQQLQERLQKKKILHSS